MKLHEKYGLFIILCAMTVGTDTAAQEIARFIGLIIGGLLFIWTDKPKE